MHPGRMKVVVWMVLSQVKEYQIEPTSHQKSRDKHNEDCSSPLPSEMSYIDTCSAQNFYTMNPTVYFTPLMPSIMAALGN